MKSNHVRRDPRSFGGARSARRGRRSSRHDGRRTKASAKASLTLYSGQHPQTVCALVSAFEKQTGIYVSVRSDDEGVLASQIIQEGSHSPADVFFTENSPPLEALGKRGLLAQVDASTLAKTSAKYSSPRKDWDGVSARVSTMVYNTDKLKPSQLPSSVLDLAQPKWKGKLALAPTETDFQPIVTAVAARYGKARAQSSGSKGISANASGHIYPDNEALVAQVNSGQVAARRDQQLLLVPPPRRGRRVEDALGRALLRARRPRLRDRRLGRRHPRSRARTRPRRRSSSPSS